MVSPLYHWCHFEEMETGQSHWTNGWDTVWTQATWTPSLCSYPWALWRNYALGTIPTTYILSHFSFTENVMRLLCCNLHLQRGKLRLGSQGVELESANLIPDFNSGTSMLNSEQCPSARWECHAAIRNDYQFWEECHHRQIIGTLQPWMGYSVQKNSSVDERKH